MPAPTTAAKIVRNSFWFGLETVLELVVFIVTSIAVARALGPEKLGVYTSISYPILVLNTLAGTGLPSATRKYMAEFLATKQFGLARSVYRYTLLLQFMAAAMLSGVVALTVLLIVPAAHWSMAMLLAFSVLPSMMSWLPAQANMAFEDAYPNAL